jgi:agmatinase
MIKPESPFLASREQPENLTWRIVGLPFDNASSYRKGARFGPSEIRIASQSIESYSPYVDRDLEDLTVFDEGDLDISSDQPNQAIDTIRHYYRDQYEQGQRVLTLGGDHAVSIGILRGVAEAGFQANFLCLDAHLDLRNEYEDQPLSHCCVTRYAAEILGTYAIFQWGVRSGLKAEFDWAKKHTNYLGMDVQSFQDACRNLQGKPVYLSLDLDVFDPSELPAVGNPEPGGLRYTEFITMLQPLLILDIIGVDIVELSPIWDTSGRSSVMAAEIVRELLLTVVH